MASGFAEAYGRGDPRARAFLPSHFAEPEHRAQVVTRRTEAGRCRPDVAAELWQQNAQHVQSPARQSNLQALCQGSAVAVVTGQQVGLFGGPLLTLFKAATAIRVARALEAQCGTRAVPIFWLQSEDHDVDEVATCKTLDARGHLHGLTLADEAGLPRISMEHRRLAAAMKETLAQLAGCIEGLPQADPFMKQLAGAYEVGHGWVQAFAAFLAQIFADEGLLMFNPRTPPIAPLAAPIHRWAIENAETIGQALRQRADALLAAGFSPQITPRPECTLSFYHPDGPKGPRFRLRPAPGGFALAGRDGILSHEKVLSTLDSQPLCFSTSALLRPLLQDYLLPTAAYIAGPAEIAYMAQLLPLYEQGNLPEPMAMPLIIPRLHGVVTDASARRLAEGFGVMPNNIANTPARFLEGLKLHAPGPSAEVLKSRLLAPLAAELERLGPELRQLNPDLQAALQKTEQNIAHSIHKLAERVETARLRHDGERLQRAERLVNWCHPQGTPQERTLAMPYFAARFGTSTLKDKILAAYEPFTTGIKDIAL